MKRTNGPTPRIPAPVAIVLTLCFLWLLLMPSASALEVRSFDKRAPISSASETGTEMAGDTPLMPFAAGHGDDGRVSDHDGIIGNSGRGADHASDKSMDATKSGRIPDGAAHDGIIGHNRISDKVKRAADDAMHAAERAGERVADAAENAVESVRTGAMPWVIGFLVILAVAILILALIPKRGKSR